MSEGSRWSVVVPGQSSRGVLTEGCVHVLAHAAELCAARTPRVVVFTGWSPRGGPSEAEQMLAAWPGRRDVELVVEDTARTTAQNASRSLPLLLGRGVKEATVVCTPLHALRVRYFFGALYARFGLRAEVRPAAAASTVGGLARELGALGLMWPQRRAALAELEGTVGGG